MVTLKEIAAEAGVSVSTVSRVINFPDTKAAGPEVQQRIWDIVRRKGYKPNLVAKELQGMKERSCENRHIYCLTACSALEVRDDPFFTTIISSIESAAGSQGYKLQFTFSSSDAWGKMPFEGLDPDGRNGLIIIGRFDDGLFSALRPKFTDIVYVGLNPLSFEIDQVVCDCSAAVFDTVKYLYNLGHRSIGYIGSDKKARYNGYLRGIDACGAGNSSKYISIVDSLSMEGGFQ